jgi:deoxycytidylate deaminase
MLFVKCYIFSDIIMLFRGVVQIAKNVRMGCVRSPVQVRPPLVEKIMKKPNWDEYFMEIAKVVKSRADCLRRQVGAVIVKDFRIVSTGYNGTPHGIKNCTEGGCDRCLLRHQLKLKSGENKESCICLHAELKCDYSICLLGSIY